MKTQSNTYKISVVSDVTVIYFFLDDSYLIPVAGFDSPVEGPPVLMARYEGHVPSGYRLGWLILGFAITSVSFSYPSYVSADFPLARSKHLASK